MIYKLQDKDGNQVEEIQPIEALESTVPEVIVKGIEVYKRISFGVYQYCSSIFI